MIVAISTCGKKFCINIYILTGSVSTSWIYRNNWLAVWCPLIAMTCGMLRPLSNCLEIASCLRSWNVKSLILARLRRRSQDWRTATSVIGNTRLCSLGNRSNSSITLGVSGTHLDRPFFVFGSNALLLSTWICFHSKLKISPRLMQEVIAISIIGQRYQTLVSVQAAINLSYSPCLRRRSLGGLLLGKRIKVSGLSPRSQGNPPIFNGAQP